MDSNEVIVPSNIYIDTILGVYYEGLVSVMLKSDENTFNLSAEKRAEAITANEL
jgi:dTDP-4-amino-4,6-dideoxygalactose transaminase